MKIQNKKEIDLTEDDIRSIIYEYLRKEHGDGEYSFTFKVVNKPIRSSQYWSDSIDRYEFDGVKVVVKS